MRQQTGSYLPSFLVAGIMGVVASAVPLVWLNGWWQAGEVRAKVA